MHNAHIHTIYIHKPKEIQHNGILPKKSETHIKKNTTKTNTLKSHNTTDNTKTKTHKKRTEQTHNSERKQTRQNDNHTTNKKKLTTLKDKRSILRKMPKKMINRARNNNYFHLIHHHIDAGHSFDNGHIISLTKHTTLILTYVFYGFKAVKCVTCVKSQTVGHSITDEQLKTGHPT